MVVEIRIEVGSVELLHALGVGGGDVAVAHVFADDGAVLGFDQSVIVAVAGTAFGLFDQQLVQQTGDDPVDELAAVVGMETENAERKLPDHGAEHGFQPGFADALGGGHDLPLRDLIDGVDVVDALAGGRIALVHGVHAQVAGLALRIGTAPFADGHRDGPGLGVVQTAFAIARVLPQVVEVGHRDRRQALVFRLAVLPVFSFENAARGRTAQVLVRLIDGGQQFEIGAGVALREAMTPIDRGLHRAARPIARDQPRHLRPAEARHLGQIEPDQSSRPAALLVVLLEAQHLFDPVVNLGSAFALESDGLAGL